MHVIRIELSAWAIWKEITKNSHNFTTFPRAHPSTVCKATRNDSIYVRARNALNFDQWLGGMVSVKKNLAHCNNFPAFLRALGLPINHLPRVTRNFGDAHYKVIRDVLDLYQRTGGLVTC